MISLIEKNRDQLVSLCQSFGVLRLDVFGSAAVEKGFDFESDLDFLVELQPEQDLGPWLQHYFEFRGTLESLFERPIDLVMSIAIKNVHFIREVNRTREVLYAA